MDFFCVEKQKYDLFIDTQDPSERQRVYFKQICKYDKRSVSMT